MSDHRLVIQISDTHIVSEGLLHDKVDSFAALDAVLTRITSAVDRPDAILLTGDLADSGHPNAYRRLRDLVSIHTDGAGIKVVFLPGNHDEREAFRVGLLDGAGSGPIDSVEHVGG